MMAALGNNEKSLVNVLWTGGWDSTFRIIQLSSKDLVIQPYYIRDNVRESEQYELNAIHTITKDIRGSGTTLCVLNDVEIVNENDLEEDDAISEAYRLLRKRTYFGTQYDMLARFAKQCNHLELTIHEDDKALDAIEISGDIKTYVDRVKGAYQQIDPSSSSEELIRLFGNFHFPILEYSKLDMKKEAEEKGFIDLMHKTWFCHYPINDQPCGRCNPCIYTMEEGLGYRLSDKAVRRYKVQKFLAPVSKTYPYKILIRCWKLIKRVKNR